MVYYFVLLYGNVNSYNHSNYQGRRPDSVNLIAPSAKLMPSRNDTLIQTVKDIWTQENIYLSLINIIRLIFSY